MDKASVALSATEDNAAAIRELNKRLLSRTNCKLVDGKQILAMTSFGTMASDGTVGIIVTFAGTAEATLNFGNGTVVSGPSPLIAVLPKGEGLLRLSTSRARARALLIGAVK